MRKNAPNSLNIGKGEEAKVKDLSTKRFFGDWVMVGLT